MVDKMIMISIPEEHLDYSGIDLAKPLEIVSVDGLVTISNVSEDDCCCKHCSHRHECLFQED